MTDTGITLNIYNKPPQFEDNTIDNINQTETAINATNTLPTKSLLDNLRVDQTSAPRANYDAQITDNTRDNTRNNNNDEESPNPNYQNNERPIPIQQYPQQPAMRYQQPQINQIPINPVPQPVAQPYIMPYNEQYAQPVIVQQRTNYRPKTMVIKEKRKDDGTKECCGGFLAGCCAVLTACCVLSMFSGGGRGYRRRW